MVSSSVGLKFLQHFQGWQKMERWMRWHFRLDLGEQVLLLRLLLLYPSLQLEPLLHYEELFTELAFINQGWIRIRWSRSIGLFDGDSPRIINYQGCYCLFMLHCPTLAMDAVPPYFNPFIMPHSCHPLLLHYSKFSFSLKSWEHKIISSSLHYLPKLGDPQRITLATHANFSDQNLIGLFFANAHKLSLR